ncbi:hypothetical protein DPMN_099997 [Dreissena polymorpha]|uniref:Uncharacterized protein n=1 Tax=Dreissena polymorpha TaxID=45954 RepID=A0A9D4LF42_DREPO|nr:hypothetical protein DPMN_099997 [Dreissena polymorpha]
MNLLTKFHEDRTINVASRVLTRKNAPPLFHNDLTINVASRKKNTPLDGHVIQPTGTIFKHIQYIIGTNLLTKFHEDRTIYLASRVLTRKNAPPPGGHVFKGPRTIFEFVNDIIGTNLQEKFHDYWKINVACIPYNEKYPVPGGHVFQPTGKFFGLVKHIIGINLLTKFHDDWKINQASRVLTWKNAPPPGGHIFQPTGIIFELTINVASRVLTRRDAPPIGSHVFSSKYIIEKNLLTIVHEDWTINLASRENAPPPGGHVFQPTGIIFELENVPYLGSHVFQAIVTIFEVTQDIIEINLLTKFHEEYTINVDSRVLTMFYYSHKTKNAPTSGGHVFQPTGIIFELQNAPPLCSHVFQANVTIFEVIQDIIKTNLQTKVHEDWTINVASRMLTRQMLTPHDIQRTTIKRRSQKLNISTLCSGELKTSLLSTIRI